MQEQIQGILGILPMYNVHPYFSLKNLGKNMHIIHCKIQVHGL